jgi:aspartate/methionine/tyrosine aminotransferase
MRGHVEVPVITIAPRVGRLVPTAVNAILADVRRVQATGRSVVSLMRGEPDFRTPPHIVDAATEALRAGRTGYPDNRGELRFREAVAAKLARTHQGRYDPATEVLATTGATLGLYCALAATLAEGDEVLLPDPIYDAYRSPIALAGGVPRYVRAPIVRGRFALPLDALEHAVTPATRVLLLNSPWNPVGTVFSRAEVEALADFVVRHRLTLISDEIYETIVFDGHEHVAPCGLSNEVRERTIVVNSLSKTYAMPGWRVGYCAAPAPVIQAMFLVLQQSSRGPATFVQDAAAVALTGPQDAVSAMQREYAARRAQVARTLAGLPRVRALDPEGGFFTMVDVRETGLPSNDVRLRLLEQHGLVVAHGAAYGAGGEGTLRVSFASGGENLTRGLERLREGLSQL